MAKRDPETQARLSSILWAALAYLGKKSTKRDLIPIDAPQRVDVRIEGRVGRAKVSEHIVGTLTQSPYTEAASHKAAPPAHVLAYVLDQFEDTDRAAVCEQMLAEWRKSETLPAVDDDKLVAARELLAQLRSTVTTRKAGSLVFVHAQG